MLRIQKSKIQKYLLPKSLWYYITCLIGPITINMSKYISSDGKNPDKKFSSVRYLVLQGKVLPFMYFGRVTIIARKI